MIRLISRMWPSGSGTVLAGLAVAIVCALTSGAEAAITRYGSDPSFEAAVVFTKQIGAAVRRGNGKLGGDFWEHGIVDGGDAALSAGHYEWAPGANDHSFAFKLSAAGAADLKLGLPGSPHLQASGPAARQFDTLILRAQQEGASGRANLGNIKVRFANGDVVNLGSLGGDSDGQWLMLQDSRLAEGFKVTGFANFTPGTWASGSRAFYNIKVGVSTVTQTPLPAALPLLAGALGGLGLAGSRRRRPVTGF